MTRALSVPVAAVRQVLRPLLDYALPPRCPACGEIVDGDRRLCLACWQSVAFLGPPWCAACNLPFDYDRGADALCGQCLAQPPDHDGVRAGIAYGDVARTLVLRLKYGRRIGLARLAADQMRRNLPHDIADWTIVPVPLHRWRIWSRGFNQAMLIAHHIAADSGARVADDWVVRTRHTRPLKAAGRQARAKAMRGAFAVPADRRDAVKRARILLIDDVYTSGATTNAVARVMKRAGAGSVVVACWARVLPDEVETDA